MTATRIRIAAGALWKKAVGPFSALARLRDSIGLTPVGSVVLIGSVGAWFVARAVGARAVFLLAYGAMIALAASWLLGKRRPGIQAERSGLPQRVTAGQPFAVDLRVTAGRRASNLILEESVPVHFGMPVNLPVPVIPGGKTLRHLYNLTPRLRGVFEIGPLMATWGDPIGMTKRRASLRSAEKIIVHPAVERVADRVVSREWEDPPIRPPVSKPWPIGFEFYGMRDYVPGDDPRRIVWRATARMTDPATGQGRYLVRESEQGITDRVAIVLDTDRRSHGRQEPSDSFETAVRVVASLAVRHLQDGFAVSVESNSRRLLNGLRSTRHRVQLLDELSKAQLEDSRLSEAIRRMGSRRSRDLHNVVVTPHLDEESAARLRLMLKRGTSVLVALVLTEDFDHRSLKRAASLGCSVVEVVPGMPLEASFRKIVGAGIRRQVT